MEILVLGIGNAQVDLIKLLTENHTVHALSYSREGRGLEFADYFEKIDIKDEKGVEDYTKRHAIELIYSVGSDLGMVTSAKVSYNLNLPSFIVPNIVSICHNKHLLRTHLDGIQGNINHKVLRHPDDIGDFEFPCIIKPVDCQGQRGVYLVDTKKELKDKFDKVIQFSKTETSIVEHYVEGPEVSINAYVKEGKIRFSIISDRIVWPEYPGGLIRKHRMPSQFVNEESTKKINALVKKTITKLGIKNGPVYFQIKLEDHQPKIIEVTPRLDGCHLWRLIKFATGVDLMQTTIDHLIDNIVRGLNPEVTDENWVLEFMCEEPSKLFNKDKYDLDSSAYHEWYYEDGETVRPINTYWEKCGYKIYTS